MRITGGIARGIPLKTVSFPGFRPAMDRTREALFSSLQSMGALTGARVLDLFAGSGAYGLEALSRGASQVVWVEKNPRAIRCIQQNLAAVLKSGPSLREAGTLICQHDATRWKSEKGAWDLIFCDPPYEEGNPLMRLLWQQLREWLNPQTPWGICWEAPQGAMPPEGVEIIRRQSKGVNLMILRFSV